MLRPFRGASVLALVILAVSAASASAAVRAPGVGKFRTTGGATPSGCMSSDGSVHCYTPQDITAAYGVDALHDAGTLGKGQTIVLVDSYGSPTAASDLRAFQQTFYPDRPAPDFDQVFPNGQPDYSACDGNGTQLSGACAAEGWAGEATLDIEWAYTMAPKAHIVLLAVPPAETLGVQGLPDLFKAISGAIDTYPRGTVFSMSFGFPEHAFEGAGDSQTTKYDAVFQQGKEKGDTFFASSGDDGTTGTAKQQHESSTYSTPTVGWPASSPWVTAVGGTQLQYGWTWDPTSDVAYLADGSPNPAYFASDPGGDTEAVWNESFLPAATGGGPSALYARPPWQSGVANRITDADGAAVDARGVPDVSWNAAVNGGVLVYESYFPKDTGCPCLGIYGGTSAASPQVAGVVALANEQQRKAGEDPIGYLDPLLYQQVHGAGLRDIGPVTEGTAKSGQLVDNRLFDYNGDGNAVTPGDVAGHPVLEGWDETTGFGSPEAQKFVAAIRSARNDTP